MTNEAETKRRSYEERLRERAGKRVSVQVAIPCVVMGDGGEGSSELNIVLDVTVPGAVGDEKLPVWQRSRRMDMDERFAGLRKVQEALQALLEDQADKSRASGDALVNPEEA